MWWAFFPSQDRTLKVRIEQATSNPVNLESGVPQGSVFTPTIWNYFTGGIPTNTTTHSDTSVYADDAALANSHPNIDKLLTLTQTEITQLHEWTKPKHIKFEP